MSINITNKKTFGIESYPGGIGELPKCDTFVSHLVPLADAKERKHKRGVAMNRSLKHNYRVTEYEDRVIRNKAKRAKISVSAYVRKSTLEKDIIVIEGLREVLPELHAIGNNLNQQTVIMRQNGGYAPQVEEMKNKFCGVMDTVKELLKSGDADGDY